MQLLPLKIDHICRLPHFRERTEQITYIILHCSAGNPEQQLKTLDENGLSVHYIIGADGSITEVIEPDKVAYHAGISHWRGSKEKSLNGCSIGIEIESPDLGQTAKSYTAVSIYKLCLLLQNLCRKYKIRKENILGHSDIAPTRKPDPGAGFPWIKLRRADLTYGYHGKAPQLKTDEKELLQTIGYDTENLAAARYAFCRRWLPKEIAVISDIKELVEHPYPENFTPKDFTHYRKALMSVATAVEFERQTRSWYLEH